MKDIGQFKMEGFAKKYFNTHKRGILFKKKVPVAEIIVFTKVLSFYETFILY